MGDIKVITHSCSCEFDHKNIDIKVNISEKLWENLEQSTIFPMMWEP